MIEDGIIKAPINVKEAYQILGVGTTSNGYDIGYICSNRHGKINMWSRYKPVRWKSYNVNITNTEWWKGEDGKCGIDFSNASALNYKEIPEKMTADGKNGWEYLPPNGNPFCYRILDFIKYKHDAKPPIRDFAIPEKVAVNGSFTAMVAYEVITPDKDEPGSIAFEDITGDSTGDVNNLGQYYLGVYVTDSQGVNRGRVVGGDSMALTTRFSVNGFLQGSTYNVYPFLAKYEMGQMETDKANIYYTLPNSKMKKIKIVSKEEADGISIGLTAAYTYENGIKKTVSWTLTITAKPGKTFTNNAIYLRFLEKDPLDTLVAGEVMERLMDITANPSFKQTGSFKVTQTNKDYYVYLTLQTGAYTRKVNIMSSIDPDIPAS